MWEQVECRGWRGGGWVGGRVNAGGCSGILTESIEFVCVDYFFGGIGMQEVDGTMWTSGDERGVDEVGEEEMGE